MLARAALWTRKRISALCRSRYYALVTSKYIWLLPRDMPAERLRFYWDGRNVMDQGIQTYTEKKKYVTMDDMLFDMGFRPYMDSHHIDTEF